MTKPKLLIVDDNVHVLSSLERVLEENFTIWKATAPKDARTLIQKEPDIVLLDINLNERDLKDRTGVVLLQEFLDKYPNLPVVMISAYGDVPTAVQCMHQGAADFIQKPPSMDELSERLNKALTAARTSKMAIQLEERLQQLEPIQLVGSSKPMASIKHLVKKVSQDPYATILIQGETGTGKELVARALHNLGFRRSEPCVAVSIASLNPNLVESELFGHVRGAFAGAHIPRVGFFEKAKGGVLFLDEIGELSLDVQVKLLRFLEERVLFPVGSSNPMEVDVQVVAATNRDLSKEVSLGRFREDLYYRLKVIPIFLTPLRERTEDIPLLVEHFLGLFRRQGRTNLSVLSTGALESLQGYHWPGNVRQLKNELERAILNARMEGHLQIEREDLSPEILNQSPKETNFVASDFTDGEISLDEELAKWEFYYIQEALKKAKGRKSMAWQLIGLNDRYALTRRVKTCLKKYPHLIKEFPLIQKLYKKHIHKQ